MLKLKGWVETLLKAIGAKGVRFTAEKENPSYHPGRCAAVWSGNTRIGTLGQVHPAVCRSFGLDGDTYCAELDTVLLLSLQAAEASYVPLPRFPAITRDLALLCDETLPVGELAAFIRAAETTVLRDVKLFDVYTGKGIPEGKKSATTATW